MNAEGRVAIPEDLVFDPNGLLPVVAQEDDKREGSYYPPVESEEIFGRTLGEGPPTDRTVRVAFVNEVTRAQFDAASKPRFAVFAKGAEAEHMIITALDDDVFKTLFRARAVLAQMTASARQTDFCVKTGINLYGVKNYVGTFAPPGAGLNDC